MEWWTIIHGFPMLGRSMDHNGQSNYMMLGRRSLLQIVINPCMVISNTNTNTIILVPHTSTAFVSHHRTSPFSPSALSLSFSLPSPYLPPSFPPSLLRVESVDVPIVYSHYISIRCHSLRGSTLISYLGNQL